MPKERWKKEVINEVFRPQKMPIGRPRRNGKTTFGSISKR
jgi:hypothetical protein